jgi:adenosylmethionine-8-amino-7-oxononanoate aminotransferase
MLPPYIITEQEADRAVKVLDKVLKKAKPLPVDAH